MSDESKTPLTDAAEKSIATYHDGYVESGFARDLELKLARKNAYIEAVHCELNRHTDAAAIFQVGGRFHEAAHLRLGSSTVVAGIKWLTEQYDRLTAQAAAAQAMEVALENIATNNANDNAAGAACRARRALAQAKEAR